MAYKRLEEHNFTWPTVRDGLITLSRGQFEAPFPELNWRRVRATEARATEAAGYRSRGMTASVACTRTQAFDILSRMHDSAFSRECREILA